ncbi:MAG: aquaporin, partial [Blastocatellia bacterium]|nr:aquaporin [Blastocatellia bacterium]
FANPAVTLARAFSNTFAGIRPADAPGFILAQLLGAAAATLLFRWILPAAPEISQTVIISPKEETYLSKNEGKADGPFTEREDFR